MKCNVHQWRCNYYSSVVMFPLLLISEKKLPKFNLTCFALSSLLSKVCPKSFQILQFSHLREQTDCEHDERFDLEYYNFSAFIQKKNFFCRPIFENEDGSIKKEGDIVRRPQLAKTLEIIAEEGMQAFYNGSLTSDILKDLQDGFGDNIITEEDLNTYQ